MTKKLSWKELGLHVMGAVAFLALPILFNPRPNDLNQLLHNFRTLQEVITYLLMIVFFYVNYYTLIPTFFFTRKYSKYTILAILCFVFVVLMPDLLTPEPPPELHFPSPFPDRDRPRPIINIMHFGQNLFLFLIVLFFSLMARMSNRWKQAEKDRFNAEIAYLKAQINPHFLFNTLNGIYALALQKSNDTASAVVKLSNMMRYVLTEASAEWVSLDKELEYLKNYIELQHLRFGNSLQLNLSITGDASGKQIAPMLIIPLIENAFKYGVSPEELSEITLHISIEQTQINFTVVNKKVNVRVVEKTGLGLQNVRQRLALIYPNLHEFTVTDTSIDFTASLTLLQL